MDKNNNNNQYKFIFAEYLPESLTNKNTVGAFFAYYLINRYVDELLGAAAHRWAAGGNTPQDIFFKLLNNVDILSDFSPYFFLENVFLPDLTENHYKKLTQLFYLGLRELKREGLISSVARKQKRFNDDEKYNYQTFKLSDKFEFFGFTENENKRKIVKIPNYVFTNSFKKEQNTNTEIITSVKAFCVACFILKSKAYYPVTFFSYKGLSKVTGCSIGTLEKYCKLIENNKILFRYTTRQWGNPTKMTPQVFSLLEDEEAAREAAFEYRGEENKGKTFDEDEYSAETWE